MTSRSGLVEGPPHREARVVHIRICEGLLGFELYENTCADAFWRLAKSGQLSHVVFEDVLPGLGVLVHTKGAEGHVTTVGDVDAMTEMCENAALRHVGAGLLSCRLTVGTVMASSFLITLSAQPALDHTRIVFGRMFSGLDVVSSLPLKGSLSGTKEAFAPVVLQCVTGTRPRTTVPGSASPVPVDTACVVRSHGRLRLLDTPT
ncbi:cyclophilin 3 [Novymonas esmeraldas]|uniref:Cyclophilin 3 n=1 Tax=Novymonas esmeraldas TaxID=1808958 RepID=A0AAW0EZU2_9TRYP